MGEQVDRAVKCVRQNGAHSLREAKQIVGALISQEIVQWPTEPRIIGIDNASELKALPIGTILRVDRGPFHIAFYRDDVAWWATGSEDPVAISQIPLPVEVLV